MSKLEVEIDLMNLKDEETGESLWVPKKVEDFEDFCKRAKGFRDKAHMEAFFKEMYLD